MLHASAACIDGSAVMLCAESGSGKSSLLMGLAAAGWQAVSEDQCVVDLDSGGAHRVWPGPSWARLKRGAPLPPLVAGSRRGSRRSTRLRGISANGSPTRRPDLDRIVLLEPPGGSELSGIRSAAAEVIGSLTRHATWFQRSMRSRRRCCRRWSSSG